MLSMEEEDEGTQSPSMLQSSLTVKRERSPGKQLSSSQIADKKFVNLLVSMRKSAKTGTQDDLPEEDIQFLRKACSTPSNSSSLVGSKNDLPIKQSFKEINEHNESSGFLRIDEKNSYHGLPSNEFNTSNNPNNKKQKGMMLSSSQISHNCQEQLSALEEKIIQWLEAEGVLHVSPEEKMAVYFEERKKSVTSKFKVGGQIPSASKNDSSSNLNATPIRSSNSLWERRKQPQRKTPGIVPLSCFDLELRMNFKESTNFSTSYDL